MPSIKAYRARKHDIEVLEQRLADAEAVLRETQIHLSTMNEVKEALLEECKKLTTRCTIFEMYIRHAYWDDPDLPVIVPSTIPRCLKPFDAIKFAGGPIPMVCPPEAQK
jgi:hypothetical protein